MAVKNQKKNLILYHTVSGRYYSKDLKNGMELPTLYEGNPKIRVNKYGNGVQKTFIKRCTIKYI